MADVTIKLGAKEFKINSLTIRQSRDLRVGDNTPAKDDGVGGWMSLYELCMKTIFIAVSADNPELKEEDLWSLPATEDEMAEARKAILIHAGFRSPDPTIAELRATVAAKKIELEALEKTLAEREEKAKITGEG
jgi:hypothetical protein